MARTKIFVSFEYKTGYGLKETLIGQARQPDSPFSVTDFSLQKREPESDWLDKAKRAIERCDVFVTLLSENTHNAPGVLEEIKIARRLRKPRFQLRAQGHKWRAMRGAGKLVVWTWANLQRELAAR